MVVEMQVIKSSALKAKWRTRGCGLTRYFVESFYEDARVLCVSLQFANRCFRSLETRLVM